LEDWSEKRSDSLKKGYGKMPEFFAAAYSIQETYATTAVVERAIGLAAFGKGGLKRRKSSQRNTAGRPWIDMSSLRGR